MSEMNIYEKLSKIQTELKVPKDKYNSFGSYNYRNAESIMEAVKPLLKKYGCALTLEDCIEQIGDRYYLVAEAQLTDIAEPNYVIVTQAYAREEETKKGMDASQITGSASSYARKYALNGLFILDDSKDADYEIVPADTTHINTLKDKLLSVGKKPKELKAMQGITGWDDPKLTIDVFKAAMDEIGAQ